MGFIEENLLSNEKVIYSTKLHWIIFGGPIALFVLSLLFLSGSQNAIGMRNFLMFISLVWAFAKSITLKYSEFAVTNQRVSLKVGWIKRASVELLLSQIESIEVYQKTFARMFNYGTIVVNGTGRARYAFDKIEQPLEFRRQLQEQLVSRNRKTV